jgi:mannan endo-1,4-beta-mannosidase
MSPETRTAARRTSRRRATRTKRYVALVLCAVVVIGAAAALAVVRPWVHKLVIHPTKSVRYVGVYEPDAPTAYTGVDQFAQAIGRQPNLVSYYSDWDERFQAGFVTAAARHGAITLIQIDPKLIDGDSVSLAAIAAGHYDAYLRSYAARVKAFGGKVILSFGHEMNGSWYSWGYLNTPPKFFTAAWRHLVTVFREAGASNVIWLWTVNVINTNVNPLIPNPVSWWPGSSYVNWVAIDGYYTQPSQSFSQLFGPTVVAVRALTPNDPMLIAETGAPPSAGQPAKINDLFDGIRTYGLYGFVWLDENTQGHDWRISSSGSFAAFGHDAKEFMTRPATPAPALTHPSAGNSSP